MVLPSIIKQDLSCIETKNDMMFEAKTNMIIYTIFEILVLPHLNTNSGNNEFLIDNPSN